MGDNVVALPDMPTPSEVRVLDAMSYGWRHIDAIARDLGWDRSDTEAALKELAKKRRVAGVGLEWSKIR